MRTVLMFAYECAPHHDPAHTMAAQRPYQFAKWLPHFGWKPIVVCCDFGLRRNGGNTEWENALARLCDERDPGPVFVRTGSQSHGGRVDKLRQWAWPTKDTNGVLRAVRVPLRKLCTGAGLWTGDYSSAWVPTALSAGKHIFAHTRIDALWGTHGPDAAIRVCSHLHARSGIPWIADFRDPALEVFPQFAHNVTGAILRRQLTTAAAVVQVNAVLARLDGDVYRKPVVCITNGFDEDEYRAVEPERFDHFTIVYTGSISPEAQDPSVFFEGMRRFLAYVSPPERDRFRFVYAGNRGDLLLRLASRFGLVDVVEIRQRVKREKAIAMQKGGHLLLILTWQQKGTNPYRSQGYCPGKIFEYMGAGRPILAVPGDEGLSDALISLTGSGAVASDAGQIAGILKDWFLQFQKCGSIQLDRNEAEIRRYTRKAQTSVLASVLEEISDRSLTESRKGN